MTKAEKEKRNQDIIVLITIGLVQGVEKERIYEYVALVTGIKRRQVINVWNSRPKKETIL